MAYEVYTYGNVEAFVGMFNALASMMGSDTFTGAMHLATLLGAFSVLLYGVFGKGLMVPIQWLLGINLITLVLFAPRTEVMVVDRLSTEPAQVVAGVPFIMGLLAHDITLLGDSLTRLTETAFQVIPKAGVDLPQSMSYQQNGVMFGARLVSESRKAAFEDPNVRTDFTSYVRDCLVPDFNTGYKDPAAFGKSNNVWADMGDTNPGRYTYVGNDVKSCPAAYDSLTARVDAESAVAMTRLAVKLAPGYSAADANDRITQAAGDIAVRAGLGAAAADAGALIRQNAIINMLRDSYGDIARQYNDPASVMMATAEATIAAQTNSSWIISGKFAESALPKFRGIAQALSYALFPFILIMGLAVPIQMFGKLFVGWLKFMGAIELWPPLFAILNYFGTLAYEKSAVAAAAFGDGAGGLAITSASAIYSTAISDQAIIGYISLSIPVIAWALVNNMQGIMTAFSAGTALQQAVHGTAGQTAVGNVSQGQTAFNRQMLGSSIESADMFTRATPMGTTIGSMYGGQEVFKQSMGSLASKPAFGESEVAAVNQRRGESLQVADREGEARSRAESAALGHALAIDRQAKNDQQRSGGASVGTTGSSGRSTSLVRKINDAVDSQLGKDYSASSKNALATELANQYTASIKMGTPDFLPLSAATSTAISARLSQKGEHVSADQISAAYKSMQSAMREQGVTDTTGLLKDFKTDDAYRWSKGAGVSGSDKFDASYQQAVQHQRNQESALTEAKTNERSAQFMHDWNAGVQTDATNFVWQQLQNRGQTNEYQRLSGSDPLRAQGMIKDILMDYASFGRTSPENGGGPALIPGMIRDGKEWTSSGWNDLSPEKLREHHAGSLARLSEEPTVQDVHKQDLHVIQGKQDKAKVSPDAPIKDDVTGRAKKGQGNVDKAQSTVAANVASERNAQVRKYNNETSEGNTSLYHKKLDSAGGAVDRVVRDKGNKPNEGGASGQAPQNTDPPKKTFWKGGASGKWGK